MNLFYNKDHVFYTEPCLPVWDLDSALSASKSEEVSESRMMVEAPIESAKFEELRYESSNFF
jgi:hypothetical protein